jgi:hypothetical protein
MKLRPPLLGVARNRLTGSTHYRGVPKTGSSRSIERRIHGHMWDSAASQKMALAVVNNEKRECNLIRRAPE